MSQPYRPFRPCRHSPWLRADRADREARPWTCRALPAGQLSMGRAGRAGREAPGDPGLLVTHRPKMKAHEVLQELQHLPALQGSHAPRARR